MSLLSSVVSCSLHEGFWPKNVALTRSWKFFSDSKNLHFSLTPNDLSIFLVEALLASIRFLIHIFSPHLVGTIGRFAPRDSTNGVILSITSLIGQPQNSTENLSICHKSNKVMTISMRSTNTPLVPPAISLKISPLTVKSAMSVIEIVEEATSPVTVLIVTPFIS